MVKLPGTIEVWVNPEHVAVVIKAMSGLVSVRLSDGTTYALDKTTVEETVKAINGA